LLPREPGNKEARYAHLLSGDVEVGEAPPVKTVAISNSSPENARMTELEAEIASLQKEIADLKSQFAEFRKQFE